MHGVRVCSGEDWVCAPAAHGTFVHPLHGSTAAPTLPAARRALLLRGLIQGVGFRPFVHGLATGLGLAGFVRNRADGVTIELEGEVTKLAAFFERLQRDLPSAARIEEVHVCDLALRGELGFRIEDSERPDGTAGRFFPPDLGTCERCLQELLDPADRRYLYPFINCTHCGPRLTIICDAPYDRERTTMAMFAMCDACTAEYNDPGDRRFHAQPITCPRCGPQLSALDAHGSAVRIEPLSFARELLLSEGIVAVKGLGGYHLACDASSDAAVARLRARKHRDGKPFALLVANLESARRLCEVSELEAELLGSPRRPIVLLRRLSSIPIAEGVAPNCPLLGVMLPYTPLHHLLMRELEGRPLVLTSGNRSDEPIAFDDGEAVERLQGVADGFLTHERPIRLRCDDSVTKVCAGGPIVLRRSRGYAPEPLRLALPVTQNVLALGGHLKSTFALGRGTHAFLSHYLGDLGDHRASKAFREAVAHYEVLFAFEPEILVHDLHPEYATTEYARERQQSAPSRIRSLAVQHHHAHMVSCMVENGLVGPAIGVVFDGTGYGVDGSLWGGEFLVGDYRGVRRAAHLRAVLLPGGEQAVREPWRMALSHLLDCGEEPASFLQHVSPDALRVVRRMIDRRLLSPPTTSMGRLFDAVAGLLGLRPRVSFEGQAAMELEWLASRSGTLDSYPFELTKEPVEGTLLVDVRPLVRAIARAIRCGEPSAHVARKFHNSVSELVASVACQLRDQTGIADVVLSGGVFCNGLLLEEIPRRLADRGLRAHVHSRVPANDGGLCLGQLAIAGAVFERGA